MMCCFGHLSLSCPEVTLQDESKVVENSVQHHHLVNMMMIMRILILMVMILVVVMILVAI